MTISITDNQAFMEEFIGLCAGLEDSVINGVMIRHVLAKAVRERAEACVAEIRRLREELEGRITDQQFSVEIEKVGDGWQKVVDVLEKEIDRLNLTVDKFPKTADGVRWDGKSMPWALYEVKEPFDPLREVHRVYMDWAGWSAVFENPFGKNVTIPFHHCYPTRAAAEKARGS